jgi:hypothetical protein
MLVPGWPKLAWVASIRDGAEEVAVLHGPMVEVRDDWIAEAVWAGDFEQGDFDRTELVFGSGIRIRGDRVVFVTSGTVFDRLWHCRTGDRILVANSLPALMSVGEVQLDHDYARYASDVRSIQRGLSDRVRSIPAEPCPVSAAYYHNLKYESGSLNEIEKPDAAPRFELFDDYRRFLVHTARALGDNLHSAARRFRVAPLASISSGYDSTAAATISREAGCVDSVTIRDSTSFWRGSDSGAPVAKALGMSCREYPRTAASYPLEETVWAAAGWSGMVNWTLFDYPEPLCLFFTGCHGEKMWDRVDHDHPDPFVRRDVSSLGFCEFRLHRGVWQCPVPFWGVRHSHELKAITLSDEMRPWSTGKDYDKPIARRLAEDAGVPRTAFGTLKKNSVLPTPFPWPYTPRARDSFRRYLAGRGLQAPSDRVVELFRRAARSEAVVFRNVLRRFKVRKRWRPWAKLGGQSQLFVWANHELKLQYADGLRDAGIESQTSVDAVTLAEAAGVAAFGAPPTS